MTKRSQKSLLLLIAACVACSLAIDAYQFIDDWRASREVFRAKQLASANASAGFTFQDARQWLEENQFRVIIWDPYVSDGFTAREYKGPRGDLGQPAHIDVVGQKNLRRGSWLTKENWMDLTFEFTPDGKYEGVVCESSRVEIPATQPVPR